MVPANDDYLRQVNGVVETDRGEGVLQTVHQLDEVVHVAVCRHFVGGGGGGWVCKGVSGGGNCGRLWHNNDIVLKITIHTLPLVNNQRKENKHKSSNDDVIGALRVLIKTFERLLDAPMSVHFGGVLIGAKQAILLDLPKIKEYGSV